MNQLHLKLKYGLGSGKDFEIYISSINKSTVLVHMEDKQIVDILLAHYDFVLNTIIKYEFKSNKDRILNFLKIQKCEKGVCYCSRVKLELQQLKDGG